MKCQDVLIFLTARIFLSPYCMKAASRCPFHSLFPAEHRSTPVPHFADLRLPPGPEAGRFGRLSSAIRFHRNPIAYLRRAHEQFGPVFAFSDRDPNPVFAIGSEFNKIVLEDTTKFLPVGLGFPAPTNTAQERMSFHLFRLRGEDHAAARKSLSPLFSRSAAKGFYPSMVEIADAELRSWRVNDMIDLQSCCRDLSLQVGAGTLMGMQDRETSHQFGDLIEPWFDASTSLGTKLIPLNVPGTPYRRALKSAERLEKFWIDWLERHPETRSERNQPTALAIVQAPSFPKSKCPFETRHAHLNLIFGAGYDTSTSSLTWTLLLLAQHPDVMYRLREEIVRECGRDVPSLEQLERFDLLSRVLKESLRLLSPVVYTSRRASEDIVLGGFRVPAGTVVTISPFLTHRDARVFPDPSLFDPDRWIGLKPSAHEYLPFLSGPRYCPGSTLAQISLKLMLARIVQRFSVSLAEGSRIDPRVRITLRSRNLIPAILSSPSRMGRRVKLFGSINDLIECG